jgi:hypothetical protein
VSGAALSRLLAAELEQPAPTAARALAAELARRGGTSTRAVLYYGSALRADSIEGILDFYVLLDDVRAWPGSLLAHAGNRLLPPNVGYLECAHEGHTLRAKFAVMSGEQFARRLATRSLDTTVWARFCQPALLAWSRAAADRDAVVDWVRDAVVCAADWAARLGPPQGKAEEFWRALFARTYAAELRVERTSRALDIVGKSPARYAALLPLAWDRAGVRYSSSDGTLMPDLDPAERAKAARRWAWRASLGRPLNVLRLLKAAFTFQGAMDYAAWKVERHSGVRVEVAPWQRRFPLLAAPGLYWKLRRRGVLK